MSATSIEWTDAVWNPVSGCDRISPGCDHCYALTMARRLKAMGQPRYQADGDPRTSGPGFAVTCHPEALAEPYRWRKPRLVFVNSMGDLFHARVPLGFVRDVFAVIAATPQHTYQVLTKRSARLPKVADQLDWPANLWMGVSVEHAATAHRVRSLTVTTPHPKYAADPDRGQVRPREDRVPPWLSVGLAAGDAGPGRAAKVPALSTKES